MNSPFCIFDVIVHGAPIKMFQCFIIIFLITWNFAAKIFYSNTAVPCMHIVQFSSMKLRFLMLIEFLVVLVGSFMIELFSTNKLTEGC